MGYPYYWRADKTCKREKCKKPFVAIHPKRLYCSDDCIHLAGKERAKERFKENPERMRALARARYAADREYRAARQAAYRLADPEKFRAADRARNALNRDVRNAQTRAQRKANPEKFKKYDQNAWIKNQERILAGDLTKYQTQREREGKKRVLRSAKARAAVKLGLGPWPRPASAIGDKAHAAARMKLVKLYDLYAARANEELQATLATLLTSMKKRRKPNSK